jgi:hypothetical protein
MLKLRSAGKVALQPFVSGPSGADTPAMKTKLIDILPAQVLP